MNLKFKNKRISGILTIIPEKEIKYEDEIDNYNFTISQSMKLKLIMGYDARRIVNDETTVSDLCVFGMNYLFDNGKLDRDSIDAMVLVTQSPDHFMPPTSHVIHGRLNLSTNMICLDINQGCSGYVVGLNQAFLLLEQEKVNKVVVLNADTLSKKISKYDRNNNPQVGDGASITIVEKEDNGKYIFGSAMCDGKGVEVLKIPAGGFKMPSNEKTSIIMEDKAGNKRSLDNMIMLGDEVFNFVQREVPPMVDNLIDSAGLNKDDVDYFMFHQPNKFMLKKLADKMNIKYEKMPNNVVEKFGNSSGVSLPTAITYNLGEKMLNESFLVCMAGFGTGLNWASLIVELGKLNFCEIVTYK